MRTCVIFNPSARGEKAKRFRRHLDEIAGHSVLKLTTAPGEAQQLAAAAVREGFEIVVAAGGDGTVNEVLNGIAQADGGVEHTRLGVLPLGTINVFARELAIPIRLTEAWKCILAAKETAIDLPRAEFTRDGAPERRWFAQLAGAGLDARAVELVHWPLKKKIGPLAYVWAGLLALAGRPSNIRVSADGTSACGQLVLIGNGRLYGGNYRLHPEADLRDGLLELCVFPRMNWLTLARCGPELLIRGTLPGSRTHNLRGAHITLTSDERTPLELDGELAGLLPATFAVERHRLRVIVPEHIAAASAPALL